MRAPSRPMATRPSSSPSTARPSPKSEVQAETSPAIRRSLAFTRLADNHAPERQRRSGRRWGTFEAEVASVTPQAAWR